MEQRRTRRREDIRLLTGNGRFIEDLDPLPRTARAAVVRSTHAHARIVGVDAKRALEIPGVLGVLTGDQVRKWARPFQLAVDIAVEYYPIAVDRVRYVGEPVAVVVAEDQQTAVDAAGLVDVEYEPLPAVIDVDEAMGQNAPLVHPAAGTNVAHRRTFSFGSPQDALAAADVVVQERFIFPRHTALPLETYGVIAYFNVSEPSVTIWANFHGPFVLHTLLANALQLPLHSVRLVVPTDIGGSFGIKSALYPYMALIALASRMVHRPVKWIETRREHLIGSSAGAGWLIDVRAGFSERGELEALSYRFVVDVGAYVRSPEPACIYRCFGNLVGPYRVQHLAVETCAVMTNKCPTGLNRGFGGPQLYFALERIMDLAAEKLELDPAEIRRRNFVPRDKFPYRTPSGGVYDSGDYEGALELLLREADYERLRREQERARGRGKWIGIGLATAVDPSGTNIGYIGLAESEQEGRLPKSGATELASVEVDPLGGITVRVGTVPTGQGHETVAAELVARELSVDEDKIRVAAEMDTALVPWTITSGSYSSRFAPLGASAVVVAARELRRRLTRVAAYLLECSAEDMDLAGGEFYVRGSPWRRVSFRRVAGAVHWNAGELPEELREGLSVTVAFSPSGVEAVKGGRLVNSSLTYGFLADLAVVEVDPETWEVRVLEYLSVHDVGRVINGVLLEQQVYGALAHGLGVALGEEVIYDRDGQVLTSTMAEYGCLRAGRMPRVRVLHMESASPFTVLGAKGAGEAHTMTAPAAVANAVADALRPLGVRVTWLPLTAESLFRAVREVRGDVVA